MKIRMPYILGAFLSTWHGLFAGIALLATIATGDVWAETQAAGGLFPAGKWTLEARIKRLLDSYTSYEFGNPFPPYQAPLSQLEFPMDSWWGGIAARGSFPRFSLGVEVLTSLSSEADGRMSDSDWDDEVQPGLRTIYSESYCRVKPSYDLRLDGDLRVSDWLGLPKGLDLRPVIGFRWQRFRLVTHDGAQYTQGEPPLLLPGDGIRFDQTYRYYLVGLKSDLDLSGYVPFRSLNLMIQADWAYVQGENEDHHLLRPGRRLTLENTRGQAWHGLFGLKAGILEHLTIGLDFEFLWLTTTGSHRLVNDLFGLDFTFHYGVEVWSRQTSLSLNLTYAL